MLIPENVPVERKYSDQIKILVYGEPFVGKTTFACTFPKPLIITTDGNIKGETHPAIHITYEGNKINISGIDIVEHGWLVFKRVIKELKNDTEYETIIVDLETDIQAMCRQWVLKSQNKNHEQDVAFGRLYQDIDNEYMPVFKDLMSLKKNIVIVSHMVEEYDYKTNQFICNKPDIRTKQLNIKTRYLDIMARITKGEIDGLIFTELHLSNHVDSVSACRIKGLSGTIVAHYDVLKEAIEKASQEA